MIEQAKGDGRWKAGKSGNPAGRKPGTGEVSKLRASIAEHVPDIIKQLVELAKGGDVGAARLLLERAIAPLRAAEQPAPIEMVATTLADQGRAVIAAASAGDLAPGQAAQLLAGLGAVAKLVETDELAARVAALEQKNENITNSH